MPIKNGSEYIDSLRNRNLQVYLFGELVKEPVDYPRLDLQLMPLLLRMIWQSTTLI